MSAVAILIGEGWPEWIATNVAVRNLALNGITCKVFLCRPALKKQKLPKLMHEAVLAERESLWDLIVPTLEQYDSSCMEEGGCFAPQHLFEVYGTTFEIVEDANDEALVSKLGRTDFSLVLSLRPLVIFGSVLIDYIASKRAPFWNFHTAKLPNYRGVAPLMHVMADGNCVNEPTLHNISTGIDEGELISSCSLMLNLQESVFTNYIAQGEGMGLHVEKKIVEFFQGKNLASFRQNENTSCYFSYPSKETLLNYSSRGVRLLEVGDISRATVGKFSLKNTDKMNELQYVVRRGLMKRGLGKYY